MKAPGELGPIAGPIAAAPTVSLVWLSQAAKRRASEG